MEESKVTCLACIPLFGWGRQRKGKGSAPPFLSNKKKKKKRSVTSKKDKRRNEDSSDTESEAASSSPFQNHTGSGDEGFVLDGDRSFISRGTASSAASMSIMENNRQIGRYELISLIGKGSFGRVFVARDMRSDEPVALKVLQKRKLVSRRKQRLVMDEKRVMIMCGDHPFILGLKQSFQTPSYVCLVSEYCINGELFYHLDKAGRFTESVIRFYAAEILSALDYLHSHKIAYRDLKSENLLLDHNGHIRLADFGLASIGVDEISGAKSICGTPSSISPEMLLHGGKNGKSYGYLVDYWSLGCLMFDSLCGHPPFYHQNLEVQCEAILSRPLVFPNHIRLSLEVKDLIKHLLRRNPHLRLGSSKRGGFKAIKTHPFFARMDWNKLITNSNQPAPVKLNSQSPVHNKFDTRNFHKEFTQSSIADNIRTTDGAAALPSSSSAPVFENWDYDLPVPETTIVEV